MHTHTHLTTHEYKPIHTHKCIHTNVYISIHTQKPTHTPNYTYIHIHKPIKWFSLSVCSVIDVGRHWAVPSTQYEVSYCVSVALLSVLSDINMCAATSGGGRRKLGYISQLSALSPISGSHVGCLCPSKLAVASQSWLTESSPRLPLILTTRLCTHCPATKQCQD